jgi:hypothetical protein
MQQPGARGRGRDWIQAAVGIGERGIFFSIDNEIAVRWLEDEAISREKVPGERENASNKRQQDAPALSRSLTVCLRHSHTQSLRENDAFSGETRQSAFSSHALPSRSIH